MTTSTNTLPPLHVSTVTFMPGSSSPQHHHPATHSLTYPMGSNVVDVGTTGHVGCMKAGTAAASNVASGACSAAFGASHGAACGAPQRAADGVAGGAGGWRSGGRSAAHGAACGAADGTASSAAGGAGEHAVQHMAQCTVLLVALWIVAAHGTVEWRCAVQVVARPGYHVSRRDETGVGQSQPVRLVGRQYITACAGAVDGEGWQ